MIKMTLLKVMSVMAITMKLVMIIQMKIQAVVVAIAVTAVPAMKTIQSKDNILQDINERNYNYIIIEICNLF